MNRTIRLLPPELANKIAAGEVVQRPASVVKELIENSLDAKATRIAVVLKDYGSSLIQVTDDGIGMSPEDVALCIERHATSKIIADSDLERITTLGFRGEALASIGAVSNLHIRSRRKNDETAFSVVVEAGITIKKEPSEGSVGTSVSVRNLFFNIPARRKFLKSPRTELRNCINMAMQLALSHPECEFTFHHNQELLFDVRSETQDERLQSLLGKNILGQVIKVEDSDSYLSIFGYVGIPTYFSKRKAEQHLFLNKRAITNRTLSFAVFQSYENIIEKGSAPFFLLHLNIPPESVDINVHPTKSEVKFEDEHYIYSRIVTAVRTSLRNHGILTQSLVHETNPSIQHPIAPTQTRSPHDQVLQWQNQTLAKMPLSTGEVPPFLEGKEISATRVNPSEHKLTIELDQEQLSKRSAEMPQVWQIHNKYIISQVRGGMYIVDQHAAHERILYERAKAFFNNALPVTQQLLFPQTIDLSVSDFNLIQILLPYLEQLGFTIKPFGKNTMLLEGIPGDVRQGEEHNILLKILDEYRTNEYKGITDIRHNMAASFACHSAIKSGDRLTLPEMNTLIEQLFLTSTPHVCPHGRPVIIKVTLEELDKRFGRT